MESNNLAAVFLHEDIIEVSETQLIQLKERAEGTPLRRSRLCLHHSTDHKIQEMIIAFCNDSYVRPHRHLNKTESFHIIEGELTVVFFDDSGAVTRKIKMGRYGSGSTFIYRLSNSLWHMVVPLSKSLIIHEVSEGPFIKEEVEFPGWAPIDSDAAAIKVFMKNIKAQA